MLPVPRLSHPELFSQLFSSHHSAPLGKIHPTDIRAHLYSRLLQLGELPESQLHVCQQVLSLWDVLPQGIVVLDEAQDVPAVPVRPHAMAGHQAGCARPAGARGAAAQGATVHLILRGCLSTWGRKIESFFIFLSSRKKIKFALEFSWFGRTRFLCWNAAPVLLLVQLTNGSPGSRAVAEIFYIQKGRRKAVLLDVYMNFIKTLPALQSFYCWCYTWTLEARKSS